jgi:rubredoxin
MSKKVDKAVAKPAGKSPVWVCNVCGYEYKEAEGDKSNGIKPGTKFEDLPADWVCPVCGAGKDEFSKKK